MPTLDELFGKKGNYGPKLINLKNAGEFIKGVVTRIVEDAPTYEWDQANKRPGLQKFWVDGKPKGVAKDEAERAGLNPVTQIEIHLKDVVGQWSGKDDSVTEYRIVATGSADEREKFKAALADAGSIDVGDVVGKKLASREGNQKFNEFKIVKPQG